MMGCVFCEIVSGTLPASLVHEDAATVAFMDRRQPNAELGGHILVVPRRHVESVYELDPETGARLMETVVRIANAVRRSFSPAGLSIWQSNGVAAGQEVPHVHFHVLARAPGDGLLRVYPEKPPCPDAGARERLAGKIRAALD